MPHRFFKASALLLTLSTVCPPAFAEEGSPVFDPRKLPGRALYENMCAICHMAEGTGAGRINPPLVGSAVVQGDPATLVKVLTVGPAEVLSAKRRRYTNKMPSFAALSDEQVAQLVSYLRQDFGKGAGEVTEAQVKALR